MPTKTSPSSPTELERADAPAARLAAADLNAPGARLDVDARAVAPVRIDPPAAAPSATAELLAAIERMASDPAVDVAKFERFSALYERASARAAEEVFYRALSAAQADMRAVATDEHNLSTKSRFASYAAIDRMLRPIYTRHGFAVSFDTGAAAPAGTIRILAYVTHVGGHKQTYQVDIPADGKGPKGGDVMTLTHAAGAALSYGMRYLVRMIWNVAIGDDDTDGNAPAAIPPAPDGWDQWALDLELVAGEGSAALAAAWKSSPKPYCLYMVSHYGRQWETIKIRAAKATAAAAEAGPEPPL